LTSQAEKAVFGPPFLLDCIDITEGSTITCHCNSQIDDFTAVSDSFSVKRVAVEISDELYSEVLRKANDKHVSIEKVLADRLGVRSVSDEEFERLERMQQDLFAQPKHYQFTARQRLTRDEIHDRRLFR
jgi:hypothetical protein